MSIKLSPEEEKRFFNKLAGASSNKKPTLKENKQSKDSAAKFTDWISRKQKNLEKDWR